MPAPAFDPRTIDNFLKDLDQGLKDKEAKDKAEKQDKKYDRATDRAKALAKALHTFARLLVDKGVKPEEREKLLEEALTELVGSLIGDGGGELAGAVHDLVNIGRGKLTDEEKRKKVEDSIKKLAAKAGKALGGKETGAGIGELTEIVLIAVKLSSGDLTAAERDKILTDLAGKLFTADLIKRQLEWFVSENFLTYGQAVKIGYDLGKPVGDYIQKTLEPVGKSTKWRDVQNALPSDWTKINDDHSAQIPTVDAGSGKQWHVTVYWDPTANAARILVTGESSVTILDEKGNDVTGEPTETPSDGDSGEDYTQTITDIGDSRVIQAWKIANNAGPVKAIKEQMDAANAAQDATAHQAADAQRHGDVATYRALDAKQRAQYHVYWLFRQQYRKAIHEWFLKAATAEKWGAVEYRYMWEHYRMFAFKWDELGIAMPAPSSTGRVSPMPLAVGRAGLYALIGTIVLALLGVAAFAFTRGNAPSEASEVTANASVAASAASSGTVRATTAPNVICTPAPDISITLSGAVSGTVTKACEPWVNLAQRNARPNTPYCRLEGIPNPPQTVAGVYASQVMFILSGTKYQFTFQYVADQRNKATNGTLPVTLQVGDGDGIVALSSWPATQEIPGNTGAGWHATAGSFSIGADGTTGSIDADFASNDGKTLHAKGTWTIAKGCPPVGH